MTKGNAVDLSVYQAACIKLVELLLNISGCQVRISQGASPTVSLGSSPAAESSVCQSLCHLILASLAVTIIAPRCWWRTWGSTKGKKAPTRSTVKTRSSWTLYQLPVEAAFEAAGETALHVTASLLFRKSNLYWGGKKTVRWKPFLSTRLLKKNPLQGISFNALSQYCKPTNNNEARVQSWSFQDWVLFVKENIERCILPNVNLIIRARQLFFIAI